MSPSLPLQAAELARLDMLQRALDEAGNDLADAITNRNMVLLRRSLRHFDAAAGHVAELRKSVGA